MAVKTLSAVHFGFKKLIWIHEPTCLPRLFRNLKVGSKVAITIYDVLEVGSGRSVSVSYLDTRNKLIMLCYGTLQMVA